MALDSDVISALPLLRWRGLVAPPYDLVTGEWRNHLAPRRVPYVPGELHDWTGRGAFPMTARLYFTNGLAWAQEGVPRLFPEYWDTWKAQLLDGDPGDFEHPVLGPMRARVDGAKFELRASVRSGVIVDVSWLETVEDPSLLNIAGYQYTTLPADALAAQADAAAAKFGVYPAMGLPPAIVSAKYGVAVSDISLLGIFNAIRSEVFAATTAAYSLLTSLMADISTMVDLLTVQRSVFTYDALDKLMAFYLACFQMRGRLGHSARPTAVRVVAHRTTLDAVARDVGNSVKELMGLNLSLLKRPMLERGTPVTYYKAA